MRYKLPNFLVCAILLLSFITGCQNQSQKLKYESGKDTVESFGNGTYQIMSSPTSDVLINLDTQENIETSVFMYRDIEPFVYVIGENGYTILNYKTGAIKNYKKIREMPDNEAKIFLDIQSER